MDILLYLTELLQTRKMVGIVGLGTLYKKKSPGKYDTSQHAFIPPSYSLAFTTELKEQEELASFISQRRNISIESSNYFIGEFAEQIQAKLHDHQEADLEPIGKLKLVDNEIVFEAEAESSFGFEFYGLPTLAELEQAAPAETAVKTEELAQIEEENRLEEENPGYETTDQLEEEIVAVAGEESEDSEAAVRETEESPVDAESDEQAVHEEIAEVEVPAADQDAEEGAVQVENDEQPIHEEIAELAPIAPVDKEAEDTAETEEQAGQAAAVHETAQEPLTIYEAPKIETAEVADRQAEEEVPAAQHTQVYTEEEEPKKGMPFFMKILIILLVIVALGAIAYFINPAFFNQYLKKNFEGAHDQNVPSASIDTLKNHVAPPQADSLDKNNALVTLAKDSAIVEPRVITYEVIISAEDSDKKAQVTIERVAKKGIRAKIADMPGRLRKISAGTYTDYNLAKKQCDSLRKVFNNPEIYVQTIKPKKQKP